MRGGTGTMSWIEYLVNEAREEKLPKLSLSGHFRGSDDPTPLPQLPRDMFELTHLTSLELQDLYLTELPQEVGALTNLEELRISQFGTMMLPRSFKKLTKLKKLSLVGLKNIGSLDLSSFTEL